MSFILKILKHTHYSKTFTRNINNNKKHTLKEYSNIILNDSHTLFLYIMKKLKKLLIFYLLTVKYDANTCVMFKQRPKNMKTLRFVKSVRWKNWLRRERNWLLSMVGFIDCRTHTYLETIITGGLSKHIWKRIVHMLESK